MRGRRRVRDGSSGRERAIAGEGGVGGVMGGGFFLQLNLVKIHVTPLQHGGSLSAANHNNPRARCSVEASLAAPKPSGLQ